jgi:hypothetical protein
MTHTKFVFSYTETRDFEESVEVIMEVPERSIDEMCEFFQRFLTATGYLFEEGEHIYLTKKEKEEAKPHFKVEGDTLIFPQNYISNRADDTMLNTNFYTGSGVRGGMSEDIISF